MYAAMAERYAALFPPSESLLRLAKRLADGGRVLDVGCASGELVRRLSERAFGLERERAMARLAPRAVVGDMESLPFARVFSLALLTGNTLAHATSPDARERTIAELARVLAPGGAAVLSTVNFDRIALTGEQSFEPKRVGGVELLRRYDLSRFPEEVVFETTLAAGAERRSGRVALRPVFARELVESLSRRFREVSLYADYALSPWSERAAGTVAVARG